MILFFLVDARYDHPEKPLGLSPPILVPQVPFDWPGPADRSTCLLGSVTCDDQMEEN
jgi:hypothetical protein